MLSFHVKFVLFYFISAPASKDRGHIVRTDGQTDRRTTVKHYAPDLSMQGHKKTDLLCISLKLVIYNLVQFSLVIYITDLN